uniref:Integrase, catalytic region, zinc finger, CCHC-type, peptidase aspartic, catalytic n=1 Tax=Tanacetum cinerariifolium TaxID=118510 RepID=A0A699HFK4_TANCI|nr:integrase, catalytic region, zinc finger, CCHC-type, peptidase aspartic, catalytic [Tanacetum cinerariifolium]
MFKLDLEPLSPKLVHNRESHIYYLKHIQEQADILRETLVLVQIDLVRQRSKPSGNTKNNRISQPSSSNKINKVEDQLRSVKTRKNNKNRVNKVKSDAHVMQYMCNVNSVSVPGNNALIKTFVNDVKSGCLCVIYGKCMIAETHHDYVQLNVTKMNESKKSKFGNDQIARIVGYGDYQLGNVAISRVYYVEGLGHNLSSVGQFCDADLEVAFRKNTCFIRDLEGVNLISGSFDTNLYTISLDDMLKSSPICTLSKASKTKSWLWHQRLSHLNFGKSKKSSHQPKAENKKSDLSFLHVFGSLCYPTNDHDDLGKFDAKEYIGIFVGYAPAKKAFKIYNRRTQIIFETIHVTFDELTAMASEQFSSGPRLHVMTPATPIQEAAAPRSEVVADSPMSISISQDAPSISVVDSTIFTRHARNDLLLVHIYVDEIIFASTNTAMCDEFANQITNKFKMLMMGQMSFFIGLQISQSLRGIFINQSKYASEIVKKYGLTSIDSVDIPSIENKKMDEYLLGTPVDAILYSGMIGSLIYLTASRPGLIYVDTRHSTSGSTQFLGDKIISWSSKKQKSTAISNT